MVKKVIGTQRAEGSHWVGDGFPVRSIFNYHQAPMQFSPFLLLDYAGPTTFPPSEHVRGVGEHPHRGFETVTIIYAGEVEHKDSSGGGGLIGPGDVQWMTAAGGVVHQEMHSAQFAKTGGSFEMVQLWVNLPKKNKMQPPRYQDIHSRDIPVVKLSAGKDQLRVVAGEYLNMKGPAKTFTPINVWDIQLTSSMKTEMKVPSGHTSLIVVLSGKVIVNDEMSAPEGTLVMLAREGDTFHLSADEDSKLLFLSGEPIDDPVVAYGPFVMNTSEEIKQAFEDFQNGRMGELV